MFIRNGRILHYIFKSVLEAKDECHVTLITQEVQFCMFRFGFISQMVISNTQSVGSLHQQRITF